MYYVSPFKVIFFINPFHLQLCNNSTSFYRITNTYLYIIAIFHSSTQQCVFYPPCKILLKVHMNILVQKFHSLHSFNNVKGREITHLLHVKEGEPSTCSRDYPCIHVHGTVNQPGPERIRGRRPPIWPIFPSFLHELFFTSFFFSKSHFLGAHFQCPTQEVSRIPCKEMISVNMLICTLQ